MANEIPEFANEDEEREYWATHSAAEYIDTLPVVKAEVSRPWPKREQIRFRMYPQYLEAIKKAAERKGVPYQVLMQTWLMERLSEET